MDGILIITDIIVGRVIELIDDEIEQAKSLNHQMALGMLQIRSLIKEEFEYEEEDYDEN